VIQVAVRILPPIAWYDAFSRVYDSSLEPHYREQRAIATRALDLQPGSVVLDLPCGTGQSFAGLVEGVGPTGQVVGVDLSAGMLREARRRVDRAGWTQVRLMEADAATLDAATLGVRPDRLHLFLGMSVFRDQAAVFRRLWELLAPGGLCVLVDVHTEQLRLQGRLVNWLAEADIRQRFWEPLEQVAVHARRDELPSKPLHGGRIYLAVGQKPST